VFELRNPAIRSSRPHPDPNAEHLDLWEERLNAWKVGLHGKSLSAWHPELHEESLREWHLELHGKSRNAISASPALSVSDRNRQNQRRRGKTTGVKGGNSDSAFAASSPYGTARRKLSLKLDSLFQR
jgi:hypothetical protein